MAPRLFFDALVAHHPDFSIVRNEEGAINHPFNLWPMTQLFYLITRIIRVNAQVPIAREGPIGPGHVRVTTW
jgi:hypothetical protein